MAKRKADKFTYAETVWTPEDVISIASAYGTVLSFEEAVERLEELEDEMQVAQMQAGAEVIKRNL